jgi:hypothetical protein
MKRRHFFILVTTPIWAQTKEQRGRRILDEAIEALGGYKFRGMKDRTEAGRAYSFYNSRISGLARATIYTRYLTPPVPTPTGKLYVRERQSFGKDQDYHVLFDEENGWSITYRGAAPLPEATLTRYRETTRKNLFYFLRQRMNENGVIYEHETSEVFDNQPTDVVTITDTENNVISASFNRTSKLPIRQMFFRRDPATRVRTEEITIFSKYRDVGGVQWPFAITRHRDGEKIYEIFSESVTINSDLADQLFTLPANMKVLKPLK